MSDRLGNHGLMIVCMICIGAPQHWHSITGRALRCGSSRLATNPVFSTRDFKAVPQKYRTLVPEYVKDYVSLNQFAA